MNIPKYFKELHVAVCAITGTPRIVSMKDGDNYSEIYKDIPKEEWEAAILNWASMLPKGYIQCTSNFKFAVCGKVENKQHLIQALKNAIKIFEERIPDDIQSTNS